MAIGEEGTGTELTETMEGLVLKYHVMHCLGAAVVTDHQTSLEFLGEVFDGCAFAFIPEEKTSYYENLGFGEGRQHLRRF